MDKINKVLKKEVLQDSPDGMDENDFFSFLCSSPCADLFSSASSLNEAEPKQIESSIVCTMQMQFLQYFNE